MIFLKDGREPFILTSCQVGMPQGAFGQKATDPFKIDHTVPSPNLARLCNKKEKQTDLVSSISDGVLASLPSNASHESPWERHPAL